MNHTFNVEIAKIIGVDCAIVYENIKYWCAKNKANGKNFHNGYYWTYNSVRAFQELFPYWTSKQIDRILLRLEELEYVGVGNFNASPYDRTKWYCITKEFQANNNVITISPNEEMEFTEQANGNPQKGEPIPDSKPTIKPNDKPIINDLHAKKEKFDLFWDLYDKKLVKPKCEKVWLKLEMPVIDKILSVVPEYVKSTPDKQFRKNPLTWLNGECWNDEIIARGNNTQSADQDYNEKMGIRVKPDGTKITFDFGCLWINHFKFPLRPRPTTRPDYSMQEFEREIMFHNVKLTKQEIEEIYKLPKP